MRRLTQNLFARLTDTTTIPYLVLTLLVVPVLLWILFDKSAWPYDSQKYAAFSIELYSAFGEGLRVWLAKQFSIFPQKAPLIYWIGQFFVPLGILIGSIDIGLVLSQVVVYLAILYLSYSTLRKMEFDALSCFIASAFIASCPLMHVLTVAPWVEPLQLLATLWFLSIAVRSKEWDRVTILLHLVAAASFALLVKASSPMYCLGPGLIAMGRLVGSQTHTLKWQPRKHKGLIAASVILAAGCIGWYGSNFETVYAFVEQSALSTRWGPEEPFIIKFAYWLQALQTSFLIHYAAVFILALFVGAVAYRLKDIRGFSLRRLARGQDGLLLVSALQILFVLCVCAMANNIAQRYLLPLAAYLAVIVSWSLHRLGDRVVSIVALVVVVSQFSLVNLKAFNQVGFRVGRVKPIMTVERHLIKAELDKVLEIACAKRKDNRRRRHNIAGGIHRFVTPLATRYYPNKKLLAGRESCIFRHLTLGQDPKSLDGEQAVNTIERARPGYFVYLESGRRSRNPAQSMSRYGIEMSVLRRISTAKSFERVPTPEHPRLHIYRFLEKSVQ